VQVAKNTTCRFLCMMVTICKMDRRPQSLYSRTVLSTVCHQISVCISLISRASISLTALVSRLRSDRARHWCPMFKRTVPNFIWKRCVQTRRQNKWRAPVPGTQSERSLKAIFHCSRFARARAERTLLYFLCGCLTCAFSVRLNARAHAMKVELHSTFLACPGDWFFTWLKLVAPPARAKRLQWKMALRLISTVAFFVRTYTHVKLWILLFFKYFTNKLTNAY
jgi:hypothetical protein